LGNNEPTWARPSPPYVHPGGEFNTLDAGGDGRAQVILRGGRILEIYVNGSAITRPIQLKQPLGVVSPGLVLWERCGQSELKGRVEFKRFTVWRLPPAPPQP
jgi:hypothetical protein